MNGALTKGIFTGNVGLAYDTVDSSHKVHVFPTASLALRQTLNPRLSLTVTDAYTQSDEPSQADAFGLRTERRTFQSNSFGLIADYLMDLIATEGYYRNNQFKSGGTDTTTHILGTNASSPIGALNTARVGYELSDSETTGTSSSHSIGNTFFGSLTRQIGHFSTVGLSGSYALQSQNDSRLWNTSLTTSYGLPTGLSLSGSVGYSHVSASNTKDSSGISTNSNLSYLFTRAVISLGAFQDFRQTSLEGQNFGIVKTRGYTGSFFYSFTPFISGTLQATYTQNSFTGSGNSQSTPSQSQLTASAGLNWHLLRWLAMNAQYTYTLRNSGGGSVTGSGDVKENRAQLSLQATF